MICIINRLAKVTMMPARLTPSNIMSNAVPFDKRKIQARSDPVQAPVPGRGIATLEAVPNNQSGLSMLLFAWGLCQKTSTFAKRAGDRIRKYDKRWDHVSKMETIKHKASACAEDHIPKGINPSALQRSPAKKKIDIASIND